MTYKTKSFAYFASLMIVFVIYSNVEKADTSTTTQMAENNIENTSVLEALK